MRRWVYLGFCLFVVATQAGQLPLTIGELSLMLRSGYSSNSVMQELAQRHFVDTIDAAKETTLLNAGASPELIAALKSGTYSLSAEKTAAALQQMDAEAQRRAQQAEAARKAEARYEAQIVRERTATQKPDISAGSEGAIAQLLKGDLVQFRNGGVVRADEAVLEKKKLIAFYFSAHWCGPCRKFTPQLVDYYKRVAPEHPEFEIVFYSEDKSQYAFETYVRETNMPWLAIDYSKVKSKDALQKIAGSGIPSLVLVDSTGKVISSGYNGSQYLGPQKVMADIDAIFAGKAPTRLAATQ
jgi:nucleoredoxin